MSPPEQRAREEIDRLLIAAGSAVQHFDAAYPQDALGFALKHVELCPVADASGRSSDMARLAIWLAWCKILALFDHTLCSAAAGESAA